MTATGAGDARFFQRAGPYPVAALAEAAGASFDSDRLIHGVAPLQLAGPEHVSFLDNRRYAPLLDTTRAGAVIVHPSFADRVPAGSVAIVTTEPYLGWAKVATLFFPLPPATPGIHPTAAVDPGAQVDPSAEIGPMAVIAAGAQIGPSCRIGPGAVIGAGVQMGPHCRVGALASISYAILAARVYIYPGARIGQEGFGFAVGPDQVS